MILLDIFNTLGPFEIIGIVIGFILLVIVMREVFKIKAIIVNLNRQSSLLGLIALKLGATKKEVDNIMHSQDPRSILEKIQDFESK